MSKKQKIRQKKSKFVKNVENLEKPPKMSKKKAKNRQKYRKIVKIVENLEKHSKMSKNR